MTDLAETVCAVAADTKLETPEGSLTVKSLAAKPAPVFTIEDGRVRFRMLTDACLIAESAPVLGITLENGATFRVAPEQVLFRKGMEPAPASALRVDDELVPMFGYVEGYSYRDDVSGEDAVSRASLRVTRVEPAGEAPLYAFRVRVSGCFFVAAGVLCQAAPA